MSRHFRLPGESSGPLLDINTTPLIDVLLVLIIMLILTIAPRLHQLDLGLGGSAAPAEPAAPVLLVLAADGGLSWQGEKLTDMAELERRLAGLAAMTAPPLLQLSPHPKVAYRHVTAVLAAARRQGVHKLGVVSVRDR